MGSDKKTFYFSLANCIISKSEIKSPATENYQAAKLCVVKRNVFASCRDRPYPSIQWSLACNIQWRRRTPYHVIFTFDESLRIGPANGIANEFNSQSFIPVAHPSLDVTDTHRWWLLKSQVKQLYSASMTFNGKLDVDATWPIICNSQPISYHWKLSSQLTNYGSRMITVNVEVETRRVDARVKNLEAYFLFSFSFNICRLPHEPDVTRCVHRFMWYMHVPDGRFSWNWILFSLLFSIWFRFSQAGTTKA